MRTLTGKHVLGILICYSVSESEQGARIQSSALFLSSCFYFCGSSDFQAWTVQEPPPLGPTFTLGSKTLSDTLERLDI